MGKLWFESRRKTIAFSNIAPILIEAGRKMRRAQVAYLFESNEYADLDVFDMWLDLR